MGLFNFNREGGIMDIIRCDEPQYLVWKWRPTGAANSTAKENSIRYGSRLRVKDGEMAVFVYDQSNGVLQDYIAGPHDDVIKTANFPVLTTLVSLAFGGQAPFQAEVYFINLAQNLQVKFGIPYFDVFDPRFPDLAIECAVRGTITINITDYKNFIKLNRLVNFDIDDLQAQIKDAFVRKAKSVIINTATNEKIPVMQLETKIDQISQLLQEQVSNTIANDFGINIKRVDISAIEMKHDSANYQQLKFSTADQQTRAIDEQTGMKLHNMDEMMRINRADLEMQVDAKNMDVFRLGLQGQVLNSAAENMGGDAGGMGLNTAGMMTGMMLGGSMGSQMSSMMNNLNPLAGPPPLVQYHIGINGQQSGPFSLDQLKQMVQNGQFSSNYYVWKQGMQEWQTADTVQELHSVFTSAPPPLPGSK